LILDYPGLPRKPNILLESFKKLKKAEEAKKQGKYQQKITKDLFNNYM